jgi:hypothetical protein
MLKRFSILFFAAFLFLTVNVCAQYIVKKTPQPIAIDGICNENTWSACDSIILKDCTSGGSPVQWTRAMAVWDTQALYLAVRTQDNDVWSSSAQRDGSLYTDEVIEFFFDPDRDGKNYFEFEFNCRNALMDMFLTAPWGIPGMVWDQNWNCANIAWKAVVHGTVNNPNDIDTGMTLEVRIPWADLKRGSYTVSRPKHGDSSSVNIYRIDGRDSLHKVFSCMSPVGGVLPGSFHTLQKFARFQFSDSVARLPVSSLYGRARSASGNGTGFSTGLSCRGSYGKSIIRYFLSSPSKVALAVVTLQGVCIRRLRDDIKQEGPHLLEWDNSDARGKPVAHGLYFIILSKSGQPADRAIVTVE